MAHTNVDPELSNWQCYLFGGSPDNNGVTWTPVKGKVPNWFWRKMQYIFFGNLWIKMEKQYATITTER